MGHHVLDWGAVVNPTFFEVQPRAARDLPVGRRQWSERNLTVAVDVKSAYTQGTVPVNVWCDFVYEYLKIKPDQIVEIQDNILGNVLLIKMTSTATFQRVLGLLEAGIEWRLTGKTGAASASLLR